MIIQRRGDELLLIRQGDHAALAADIMASWQADGLPHHPRRAAILDATRNHDDGWREEDEELHVSAEGEPLDFITVSDEVKQRIWPRAVSRLGRARPYVAALVAQHALTVNAPQAEDRGWADFFMHLSRLRDEQLIAAEGDDEGLSHDYPFVRAGDLLSLMFCNGWTEPRDHAGYRAILNGITLEITPDPFGGRPVPFQVDARTLPARRYPSREALRRAFAEAPVVRLTGTALGV